MRRALAGEAVVLPLSVLGRVDTEVRSLLAFGILRSVPREKVAACTPTWLLLQ